MNLRNEKAYILSKKNATNHTFVNITEPHGVNNPIAEFTVGFKPATKTLQLLKDSEAETIFSFEYNQQKYTIHLQYNNKQNFITVK
jgi:hypothetical protein